ncbi:MAG: LEA type 2 family protein [Gemmatimonadota bacterium]
MAKRFLLILALLPAAVSPLSCTSLIREAFRAPRVRVIDFAFTSNPLVDPGLPWTAVVSLEVNNPNDYALTVVHVAYSAIMDTRTVAEGERAEETRIGASGITVVRIPVTFRPEAFAEAARRVFAKRSLHYELNGSAALRAPIAGTVRIPFSKTGTFDAAEILRKKGLELN